MAAALGALVFIVSCMGPKPGEEVCRETCLHYARLIQNERWDNKIADAGPEQHAELERERAADLARLTDDPKRGLTECTNRCNRAGRGAMAECMRKAETAEAARACDE
ncbi:MAG: hypothetical protein AAGC55_12850 [Myxococcota bacterium]